MKHIESSISFLAEQVPDQSAVKYSIVQRLRGAFHVETVGEGTENFSVSATSKTTSYFMNLNVAVRTSGGRVRILIDGGNEISMATRILYMLSVLAVLALSLFPTGMDEGSRNFAIEAFVFLVVGGFIIYDINRKLDEPQQLIDRIIQSVKSEFD